MKIFQDEETLIVTGTGDELHGIRYRQTKAREVRLENGPDYLEVWLVDDEDRWADFEKVYWVVTGRTNPRGLREEKLLGLLLKSGK